MTDHKKEAEKESAPPATPTEAQAPAPAPEEDRRGGMREAFYGGHQSSVQATNIGAPLNRRAPK